jgi:heme oxygenase
VEKLFTYHKPLEASLLSSSGFEEIGITYSDRAKTPRLARDLAALGLSARDIDHMRQCESLPPLGNASSIWGCLYVLEGATLGGQIVSRHLKASLGLTPDTGASYFSGYGEHTGPQWKAFCALLIAYAERTDDTSDILAGANATYATLDAWMRVADDAPEPATPARPSMQHARA